MAEALHSKQRDSRPSRLGASLGPFDVVGLLPVGYNLPWMVRKPTLRNPFGYFWYIHARKPMTAATGDVARA